MLNDTPDLEFVYEDSDRYNTEIAGIWIFIIHSISVSVFTKHTLI